MLTHSVTVTKTETLKETRLALNFGDVVYDSFASAFGSDSRQQQMLCGGTTGQNTTTHTSQNSNRTRKRSWVPASFSRAYPQWPRDLSLGPATQRFLTAQEHQAFNADTWAFGGHWKYKLSTVFRFFFLFCFCLCFWIQGMKLNFSCFCSN